MYEKGSSQPSVGRDVTFMSQAKLQSAMEYLMTYSWAILILAIIGAALFALGVFNPAGSASQTCELEAGFSCINYYMVQNGMLYINILQTTATPINITAMGCNSNSTYIPVNTITPQVYMPIGTNSTFGVQCYQYKTAFSGRVNQPFIGYVAVNYTDVSTGFPNQIYGTINVKIAR